MYATYVAFICLWTFHLGTVSSWDSGSNSVNEVFLSRYPIQIKQTESPVDINTKNVICANYPTLVLAAGIDDTVTLTNTGKGLWVTDYNSSCNSHATGGVLGDSLYQFYKLKFIWTNNSSSVCGQTIDGKGNQLQIVVYFYKREYGSFQESLHHRDGLATCVFPFTIGCKPSKEFPCFAKSLKQVQKPGTCAATDLGIAIKWYAKISPCSPTYAYPGCYTDENTGKKYYCETVIFLANNPEGYMSYEQFAETFGSIKNCENKLYTCAEKQSPACSKVPVIKSTGGVKIPFIKSTHEKHINYKTSFLKRQMLF